MEYFENIHFSFRAHFFEASENNTKKQITFILVSEASENFAERGFSFPSISGLVLESFENIAGRGKTFYSVLSSENITSRHCI